MFAKSIGPHAELRLLERRHADALYAELDTCRLYLRRWLPFVESTKSAADVRKFIAGALQQYADDEGLQAGIWFHGKLVGCIGYHAIDWTNRSTSIGYWLGQAYQGHGLMTGACRAMVDHALVGLKLNRVEVNCAVANHKSRAIPRRLHFQSEGVRREAEWLYDQFIDLEVFVMLARDWPAALAMLAKTQNTPAG